MTLLVCTILVAAAMACYGIWAVSSARARPLRIPVSIDERKPRRVMAQRSR